MLKNKKIIIPGLVLLAFIIILISFILFRGMLLERPEREQTFRSFQTLLRPVNTEEMNIIIFTIDTLRADHLECYGYDGVKTPNINQLSREGILFEHNIVQAPLTLPSHSSIFTGTYPLFHGIRDNGGFYLDEHHTTLAESLKSKEYVTGAFVGAFVLDSRWGLNQGFDTYFDNFDLTKYKQVSLDAVQRRGDEVLSEAYGWLEKNQYQKFFAWIHLYDPHTPYNPPEPYKSEYGGKRFGLYDGEIAYVDHLLGEFRNFMMEKNLLEKTLIVFTSDHGESLGEHKENAHGFFIYDSAIRVPLIIRFPLEKLASQRISSQVRSIDIMPTILHLVGENPPLSVQGESLLPLILKKKEGDDLPAYSETYWPNYHYGWSELKSIRKGRMKFIDAPKPELYNVLEDSGELTNLVNEQASLAQKMKRELTDLIEKFSAEEIQNTGPQKLDNDSLIKLQALGYIGSFHSSAKKNGEKLADPKDKIELYNEIKVAQFLVTEEKMDEAEEKIKDVLMKDPSVLEARYVLGNIFSRQEKYDEAIEEYKKALDVDPDYYEAIYGLASAYENLQKYDEAIIGFQRLMELDPRDTKPLLHLADIHEKLEELDEAMQYLKIATEIDPDAPVFHNKLGAIYLKKNMHDAAEQEIQKAISIERSIPLLNAHFNLALLYEAKGEFDLAIQEYKKEQECCPFNFRPDYNLGLLYKKRRELNAAITEFESCIKKNDRFPNAYVFLAKAFMDTNRDLNQAVHFAQKGLSLNPDQKTAILAHLVLADLFNRMGKYEESQSHINTAKKLQQKPKH